MKIALVKNNDNYRFANLAANLCKLDNHPMERCGSVKKNVLLKTLKNIIKISRYWTI